MSTNHDRRTRAADAPASRVAIFSAGATSPNSPHLYPDPASSAMYSRSPSRHAMTTADLLAQDFVNESHLQVFAEVLNTPDEPVQDGEATSPVSPLLAMSPAPRVRKVSALSDFAPVNMRVRKYHRNKGRRPHHDRRRDWLFLLLRWPLLIFIFLFIAAEFSFYVIIRQLVNTKEWISAWRGQKGLLRKKLRSSQNYEQWKAAALTLDEYLQFDEWKKVDEDPYYDWKLVRKVRRSLRTLREANDVRGLMGVLETCIRPNFAAVESARLYSETYHGSKKLIESFYNEEEKALQFIRESPDVSLEEKKRFFRSANTNLGITALCLSGGATFAYYHFGVVRAFLDTGLLPRVITGTSAGGLVAALVCTHTDEELHHLLVPELATRITACEEPIGVWLARFFATGARFDSVKWARKSAFFTRGSTTFKEAYMRTGRILNISVVPADRHSPTKLLNYITSPDTVIWSALLASAAVPGVLNPVVLMQKLRDGSVVPWNFSSKFKDGSLRVDIPTQALNLYFNVTNPIVSQANPHVHLFFFAPRGSAGKPVAHSKGKGWRGNFLLSAGEQWLKHELTKNFKVIRDLELLPQLLGQDWSSVFLQRFDSSITIWPRTRFWDWIRILSDPDPPELARMMGVGELVTWPKLHMIHNRARIEREIFLGRQMVRQAARAPRRRIPLEPQSRLPHSGLAEVPGTSSRQAGVTTAASTAPAVIGRTSRWNTPVATRRNSSATSGDDAPMAVDTEAEVALVDGGRSFQKRGRGHENGRRGQHERHADPGRDTDHGKYKERTKYSESGKHSEQGVPTLIEPEKPHISDDAKPADDSNNKSTGFFSRLRKTSLSSLSSPKFGLKSPTFLTLKSPSFVGRQLQSTPEGAELDATQNEDTWSSDSSSNDLLSADELRRSRYSRSPPVMRSRSSSLRLQP